MTKSIFFTKDKIPTLCLMGITAVLITVTGILFKQSFLRILPLYISLTVGLFQSSANRYASLIGGFNSILYAIVYWLLGLYASAGYAILFSFPIQIITFIQWSRHSYGSSTRFRKMTGKQRILTAILFMASFVALYIVLTLNGSNYAIMDNLSSLIGILISVLTAIAFIEYSWLMLPSGLFGIALNITVMMNEPAQITYVIFSLYSLFCVTKGFFRVQKLYAQQQAEDAKDI